MQKTRVKMYIMHGNEVNFVGEVGKSGLAIENGKLWSKDVSSGIPGIVDNSLSAA